MVHIKAVPDSSSAQAIEADKKNKRLVILALEDYFDETAGNYREGKSDKTVAAELDLSEAFVAKVRKEFYGDLSEPPEIAALRSRIAGLEAEASACKQSLTAMCQRNGWKV